MLTTWARWPILCLSKSSRQSPLRSAPFLPATSNVLSHNHCTSAGLSREPAAQDTVHSQLAVIAVFARVSSNLFAIRAAATPRLSPSGAPLRYNVEKYHEAARGALRVAVFCTASLTARSGGLAQRSCATLVTAEQSEFVIEPAPTPPLPAVALLVSGPHHLFRCSNPLGRALGKYIRKDNAQFRTMDHAAQDAAGVPHAVVPMIGCASKHDAGLYFDGLPVA
jgi:hypothetical protein